MRVNSPFVDLYRRPQVPHADVVTSSRFHGWLHRPPLRGLAPPAGTNLMAPTQIKCAKEILRYHLPSHITFTRLSYVWSSLIDGRILVLTPGCSYALIAPSYGLRVVVTLKPVDFPYQEQLVKTILALQRLQTSKLQINKDGRGGSSCSDHNCACSTNSNVLCIARMEEIRPLGL